MDESKKTDISKTIMNTIKLLEEKLDSIKQVDEVEYRQIRDGLDNVYNMSQNKQLDTIEVLDTLMKLQNRILQINISDYDENKNDNLMEPQEQETIQYEDREEMDESKKTDISKTIMNTIKLLEGKLDSIKQVDEMGYRQIRDGLDNIYELSKNKQLDAIELIDTLIKFQNRILLNNSLILQILGEIDNERGRNREIAYEDEEEKEEYIAKKTQLRNTERLKKILEDDNPELDKPDLFKIIEFENHSKHGDIYTHYKVLTERAVKVLKLIEEWREERWGDAKTKYERSYRKPSREQQETMRYVEKKVKAIHSSNEGNNKCMVAIDEKIISPNGDFSEWGILPRVQIGPYYNGYDGLVANTKLKYALLANLGERKAFKLITQEPEKIQYCENKIKNAETTIKDYEEMHPKQEGDSKITFATIKSAIKKRLIGKGER